ncbi:gamma-tubulin complex component 4 isoform X4 [Chelonia mydas]|uniref:gamma-tubulin complex component 4 isoform X4 n=1 Tax=Chelonia mydas TaxID=8469 RepID=UPI001CA85487|nr:gamma-tubulin complex component 4 isoform X4 [Chelonia mydas]
MIHELLLALSGYPGAAFTWSKRSGLQVSQELPFLHPSESSVLNRLCRLGSDYIRFTEFIEQYPGHVQQQDHHPSQQNQCGLHGIYLRAFCTGLDSVLQPYRQALLDLEQEFLADPHLSISHINYSLDQFQLLFPSVMVVVEQIKTQKIHGCQLLETVHKHSCGGLPPVRSALEKILAVCHGVMYKQLSAWMLHGLLLDQHEEFFVKQGPSSGNVPAQPEEEDDDLGIGGLTGKQLRELQDLIIKDFYLLGRGELFQAFIDTAQHMLKTPPTAVTEHDVNVAFQQSAHKVLLDDDNLLPLVHLTIEYHGKEHKDASQAREGPSRELSPREAPTSGWAALGLSYKVQWPLHILFTPAVLEKYNVVFKYLLSVRRVQAELQHCWALQMQRKHLKSNRTDAIKWRLRDHMAFLVDNLQYYLQVDVLESQFSQLLLQINSTRDFESIRLAHDHFLSNLLAQSFILLKPVFHCLNEILDLCHSFCSLVSQNLGPLDERGAAQLSILVKGFSRQSSLLFKILSSVRNHQINSDLAQLLLRLDYNKYYTQAGGTLGSFGV